MKYVRRISALLTCIALIASLSTVSPIFAEKAKVTCIECDFAATRSCEESWKLHGNVHTENGALLLDGKGWNTTGMTSPMFSAAGGAFEVEFKCSPNSEFAIYFGCFSTNSPCFIQFLRAEENYGIGCYGGSGVRKLCDLKWTPNERHRAKIVTDNSGYRFFLDKGDGYELAASVNCQNMAKGSFGYQQRSGTGICYSARATGTIIQPEPVNKPDVEIYYHDTFASFPDIIRLQNGDLLMVTREATYHMEDEQHGRVIGRISTDEGHTWGEAMVICDHPNVDDRDPFAYQTKDGTIWIGCQGQRAWTRGQTKESGAKKPIEQDYDSYIVRSFDGGKTWEEPILNSKTIEGDSFIMYPVMEMSNGEFLWMGCSPMWKILENGARQWLSQQKKVYHETHILKNPSAAKDFQWETYTHPQLGQFDEWDIAELEPGHLLAILRSSPDSNQFAQAESFDYGRTWKNHRLSGIVHNYGNRPRIDKLADGTLVVSYGLRRESKITAIPSFDGGKTWPAQRRVTILNNPNYGPNPDFAYTAMVPTPTKDGKYLFIYYAHPGKPGRDNHRGIYGNFVPSKAFQP